MLSCPDSNLVVIRWISVLQSLSFDCAHVDGPSNHGADYLSRSLPKEEKKHETKKTDHYQFDTIFETLEFILLGCDFPIHQDLTYVPPSQPLLAKLMTLSFPAG
ncbi:hypothetical protein P9112_006111 [Eukaryota sp. TZLM1-RC]